MDEVDVKMQQMSSELQAQQLAVQTSRGPDEENPALEDLDTKVDAHYVDV